MVYVTKNNGYLFQRVNGKRYRCVIKTPLGNYHGPEKVIRTPHGRYPNDPSPFYASFSSPSAVPSPAKDAARMQMWYQSHLVYVVCGVSSSPQP